MKNPDDAEQKGVAGGRGSDYPLLTSRLVLRLMKRNEADAALYRALYTCPRVMAQIAPPLEHAAADAAFARVCLHNGRNQPGHRTWVVQRRSESTGLGIVALHRAGSEAELGLMLLPQAWNGHTSRAALEVVIAHGIDTLGLEVIKADCREGPNVRILSRLLVPLGFEPAQAARTGCAQWQLSATRWRQS